MNVNELADNFDTLGRFNDWAEQAQAMLRQQAKKLDLLNEAYGILFNHSKQQEAEIEKLKEDLEDCICQGGHSDAYLKIKKASKK